MASRFFAINKGQAKTNVTQGAATQVKDVEIAIDLTTRYLSKQDFLLCLEELENYVTENQWPPA